MTARAALVTGGGGFIGGHLAEKLLAEGWRVRVLDDFSSGRPENLAAIRWAALGLLKNETTFHARVEAQTATLWHGPRLPAQSPPCPPNLECDCPGDRALPLHPMGWCV